MPAWETILVALGGGTAGTVLGALLQNSRERAAELRNMRLTAAVDLTRRGDAVRRRLRNPQPPDGTPDDKFHTLRGAWDDMAEAITVVEMLFGHASEAAALAKFAANEFSGAEDELRSVLEAGGDSAASAKVHVDAASEALSRFGEAANAKIWESRFDRVKRAAMRLRILTSGRSRVGL